jgi:aryl-alcohol dehydrogenase-like predicted oxidoreductase
MRQILLGKTGRQVSAVSLGTWSFGGENLAGTIPVGWHGQRDEDSRRALVHAWESGINHWDTADVYGNGRSEQVIGSVWDTVPRDEIFLASKVGWDPGPYEHYYHPQQMRQQVEQSLRNLQTEVIDLYYLHHCNFGETDEYFDDALEMMHRFREEGKIVFIGLSDWDSDKIMRFIDRVDPEVVQPYRNVMDDTYATSGLQAWIEEHHAGVCFFSPLKHGLLTGKYTAPATFPEGDFRANVKEFQDPDIIRKMQENRRRLEAKFHTHPQPILHGLVDALLTDAPTGCVLLGQRNVQQVAAAATLGEPLSEEDAAWVKTLYQR